MDLPGEVLRLRLDLVAVEVSRCLRSAGVPHVLLKGPSTSLWLYEPPRVYHDVDLLVPPSALPRTRAALAAAGLATEGAGAVGEEAPHSLLLSSRDGFEIDVHVSLPTVPPSGDLIWNVLADHLEDLDLGVGRVPVLDAPGRCLVLALHALNNGPCAAQPLDDLRRAQARCPAQVWAAAGDLARAVGADDLFRAGVALAGSVDGLTGSADAEPPSARAQLYTTDAPSAAFGLQRLASARRRDLPRLLWREVVPTRGFLFYADPGLPHTTKAVAAARVRRLRRLSRELPAAVAAWRAARARSR